MLIAGILTMVGVSAVASPAQAAPGSPGVPGNPSVLFAEDFENAPDTGLVTLLTDYESDPDGFTYTADPPWDDPTLCNGFVVSQGNTTMPTWCPIGLSQIRGLAGVLGQVNGSDPATNSALAAYTAGTEFAPNLIQFATENNIPLASASGRFVTFSVNVAAVNFFATAPLLRFYYVDDDGVETPVSSSAINPCTSPEASDYGSVRAGVFAADQSLLFNGAGLGIVMRNVNGASGGNDAAIDDIRILDVTPQLDKSFSPASVPVGGTSTLTLTVTNTSELAEKAGWGFTDRLPAGLVIADPSAVGGTCDASVAAVEGDSDVVVTDGMLATDDVSCTVTVDVTSDTPTGGDGSPKVYENCAANIVSKVGIDLPACASVEFYSEQELRIDKTSDASAATRLGGTVNYTVTATNTGTGDYTEANPAVVFDDLSAVLDDAAFDEGDVSASLPGTTSFAEPLLSWTGALPAGESVELTYSVTLTGGGDGAVRNVAWQPADPQSPVAPACDSPDEGGLDFETREPCASTAFDLPSLSITKVANREELPAVGEVVGYTVTVTNDGPGDYTADAPASMTDDLSDVIDDAEYNDDAVATVGDVSVAEPTLSWSGVLASGESAVITYSATYTGGGDRSLRNSACVPADQVAPNAAACASTRVPGAGLTQWKQVEASPSPAAAGSVLSYTLFFENDGETAASVDAVDDLTHVSDDGDVAVEPTSADGLTVVRTGDRVAVTGSVPAGETYSVTYQVTLRADGERGDDIATNFLLAPDADVPADPVCEPADAEFPSCTTTLIGSITYAKSVEASTDPIVPGTVLTYTIAVNSTGAGTVVVSREDVLAGVLDDAELTSNPVSDTASVTVSEVADGRFQIGGELAGGETALVTYEVTVKPVAGRGDNRATNFLVNPGDTPPAECGLEDQSCTVTPLPAIETAKSSNPESGSTVTAGQDLTYTLSFTNTGEAAGAVDHLDDLSGVLDDADLIGEPVVSDGVLGVSNLGGGKLAITGGLDADQTVTVTYTVMVKADGERGDNLLGNFLVPTGEDPPAECVADNPNCTLNLISELIDTKSVDPASGTPVMGGQELTYTLTFTNQGTGPGQVDRVDDLTHVLDDATITSEPVASYAALAASRDGTRISIIGELATGQEVTVTYKVKVNADGERGDEILANYLLNPDEQVPAEPACEPIEGEAPDCTINAVQSGSEEPPTTQPQVRISPLPVTTRHRARPIRRRLRTGR